MWHRLKSIIAGDDLEQNGNQKSTSDNVDAPEKDGELALPLNTSGDTSLDIVVDVKDIENDEENGEGEEEVDETGAETVVQKSEKSSDITDNKEDQGSREERTTIEAYKDDQDVVLREDLKLIFNKFGNVKFVDFKIKSDSGYIRFDDAESVQKACAAGVISENGGLIVKNLIAILDPLTGDAEKEYWSLLREKQGRHHDNHQSNHRRFKSRLHIWSSTSNLYKIYMAGNDRTSGAADGRTHIWVQDSIFMPDHSKVVRYITFCFSLQTCDEGHSWKYVTEDQRTWYWDEFVKMYRWDEASNEAVQQLWYKNVATLYCRTIHSWRTTGRHPETVSQTRWAAWTVAWHDHGWLDMAGMNRTNMSSEPAGPGTGTSKHIAGSKTYSVHYQSMGTDPTSWDLYLHTHRRTDGSFVDERSRLVHQSMEALRDESLTPLDDETIPDQPSSEEVNSMFKNVVGGKKKGRMYGCGSMTSTIYPHEMAPRARRRGSSSSQDSRSLRETVERQSQFMEFMRVDLQALQKENEQLRSRLSRLDEQMHILVSGLPQVPPTQTAERPSRDRARFSRGRSVGHSYRDYRHAASSSCTHYGRGNVLCILSSYQRGSPTFHRFTQR